MRRTVAVLFACLALLAAGCTDHSQGHAGQGADPPATNADGTPRVDGGGGDGSATSVPGAGDGSTGTTGLRTGPTPSTTRPGSPSTTVRVQAPDHPDSGARGPVGAFARALLRPTPATRIVVEVMVQAGATPRQSALDHLRATLADVTAKDVALSGPVALPAGDGTTSADEIRSMSDRYGRTPQTRTQAVVRLLYLDGTFSEDEDVIGVAVRGDTMAVFPEMVTNTASPFAPGAVIEEAVVVHETGHLLGLVDLVVDTGRDDPGHPGHSTNKESVMYWAVDSHLLDQALDGPPSSRFDSADRADLARIRNGA